jgi:hypothetical protein
MTSPVRKTYVMGLPVATSPSRPATCVPMVNRKPPLVRKHPLETDRGRRYRRVCADAAGSSADERRERQRQARYSERLRRAQPAPELISNDTMAVDPVPFNPPPPPQYLQIHQTNAIEDFFNSLLFTQTDPPECSTCLERYHGMHTYASQCDRRGVVPHFSATSFFFSVLAHRPPARQPPLHCCQQCGPRVAVGRAARPLTRSDKPEKKFLDCSILT